LFKDQLLLLPVPRLNHCIVELEDEDRHTYYLIILLSYRDIWNPGGKCNMLVGSGCGLSIVGSCCLLWRA
jgi:hypothetical protein